MVQQTAPTCTNIFIEGAQDKFIFLNKKNFFKKTTVGMIQK